MLLVLMMSYSNMKPSSPEEHHYIAEWVKNGGVLIFVGKDTDPFQDIQEWWNNNGFDYSKASDHLFDIMGIGTSPNSGRYFYGKGVIQILREEPKKFVLKLNGDKKIINLIKQLYQNFSPQDSLQFKNNFSILRGPYDIISVMDESVNNEPKIINGLFIDLFDSKLPILKRKSVEPGNQAFLYNLERIDKRKNPQILAAAAKIEDEQKSKNNYSFIARGPLNTTNVMRIYFHSKPKSFWLNNNKKQNNSELYWEWDEESNTCLLRFENHPDGVNIKIEV